MRNSIDSTTLLPEPTSRLSWSYRALQYLRILNGLPGKTRVVNFINRRIADQKNAIITDSSGRAFCVPSLKDPIALSILTQGEYESTTLDYAKSVLRPGDTVIDAGANIGAFAIPTSKHLGAEGHVIAIEASQRIFPYLEWNVRQSQNNNIEILRVAATASDGPDAKFFDAPTEQFGMGSLSPWTEKDVGGYPVQARSIDSIVAEREPRLVRLLKIDVEGFELEVLRGAQKTLERSPAPIVIFEFIDWAERRAGHVPGDAQRELLSQGFQLWRLDDAIRNGPPLAAPLETGGDMIVARRI